MDQKLFNYIRQSQQKGLSLEVIKQQLLLSGWPVHLVNEAFEHVSQPTIITPHNSYNLDRNNMTSSDVSDTQRETTRIKIVALWLILVGFFGVLIALGSGIAGFMSISRTTNWNSFYPISASLLLLIGAIGIGFMAIMAFKISSSLHKLEYYAYQSAVIYFSAISIGSLAASLINFIATHQIGGLVSGITTVVINGLFIVLLHSNKELFASQKITSSIRTKTIIALIIMFLALPFGLYTQLTAKAYQEEQLKEQLNKLNLQLKEEREMYLQSYSNLENTTASITLIPTQQSVDASTTNVISNTQPCPLPVVNGICKVPNCSYTYPNDIYTKGSITISTYYSPGPGTYDDACSSDGKVVLEHYCELAADGTNYAYRQTSYKCPNGCENGTCIK